MPLAAGCAGRLGARVADWGRPLFACAFAVRVPILARCGEMVVEEAGCGPAKPAGNRRPQKQEPLGHVKKTKQQVSDGFTVKAMMKNTVVRLRLA